MKTNYSSLKILINSVNKLLIDVAQEHVINKELTAGHNGPYNDPETLVRNASHWILTLTYIYHLTGENIYKERIIILAEYLITTKARPNKFSFHHRNGHKDKCNGLIGQAWTFEALSKASEVLGDSKYSKLAEEVFFQHHFNEKYGLWNRLEINGKILSIDTAFNHQLWFAASGSLLHTAKQQTIRNRIVRFLDCLKDNLTVLENGLIYHPIERELKDKYPIIDMKAQLKILLIRLLNNLGVNRYLKKTIDDEEYRSKMIHKSIGYHQFNMYAFAILKENLPDHTFWNTKIFTKMVGYLMTDQYKKEIDNNTYGFPYNPPGFEIPFALHRLGTLNNLEFDRLTEYWLNEQLNRCYNNETKMMDKNTADPITHTARLYEITRFMYKYLNEVKCLY